MIYLNIIKLKVIIIDKKPVIMINETAYLYSMVFQF
jgi:hypothetical protein